MTSRMHWVYQVLALILQAVNAYGAMVPAKYQIWVAFALGLAQSSMALYNHYFTPDGKRIAMAILLMLVLGSAGRAQTSLPPTPPIQHFVISADAAGYGGQSGTQAIAIASAGVQLTEYISVFYTNISNPTDSTQPRYHLADVNVAYELGDLLPGSLRRKLVFDTTNYIVTFQGSAGKFTAPGINRIAEGLGAYLSRPVADHMQLTCGYRVLFPGHVLVKVPTVGINFTF